MLRQINSEAAQAEETANPMSRRERRAVRRLRFVTAREARLAARLARLDYKVSGETGALRVPTRAGRWHQGPRAERSGPTYVVGIDEVRFAEPIIHRRWRRLMARTETDTTTE